MIKVSVLYPNGKDIRFDVDYYVSKHMPLAIKLLSAHAGYKGVSVERGLGGALPGKEAAYFVMCHFVFDTVEDFTAAFEPSAPELQGDIPNYTDVEPVFQISEVLLSR